MKINQISKKYKIENFIEKIKSHLNEFNGRLIFRYGSKKTRKFDGEFLESDMIIRCYVDDLSSYWIGVLAHEYAHFLQCINENKLWLNFQNSIFDNIEDLELAFHKDGKKLDKKLRKKIASSVIKMELDCDKSAIKLINKYKLPVNKKEYRSKANIVLYKYLFWAEYGVWPSITNKKNGKIASWNSLNVSKLFSEEKYQNYKNIPSKLISLFNQQLVF
jgi:hypothetical protein